MIFKGGAPVDQVVGAVPKSVLKGRLEAASLLAAAVLAENPVRLVRGSRWVPVGFADFKSVGPGPSVGAVGSTPSRSRHDLSYSCATMVDGSGELFLKA